MKRRMWLAALALLMAPTTVRASCGGSVLGELRRSRWVVEARVVSVEGLVVRFAVDAVWTDRADPEGPGPDAPAELEVVHSRRGWDLATLVAGRAFLVFVTERDGVLTMDDRCGASRPLARATDTLALLARFGLTRAPR